jgi:hypothetical protein
MTERTAPTNRNFAGPNARNATAATIILNNNNRQKKSSGSSSPIKIFIFTLIFLAAGLLCSAVYLSRELDLKHDAAAAAALISSSSSSSNNRKGTHGIIPIDAATAIDNTRGSGSNNIEAANTDDDPRKKQSIATQHKVHGAAPIIPATTTDFSTFKEYPQDRVYCMIPFIWNPKIYHAIMSTWGQRCDTIHFLTDAMVGGELHGDHISFDTDNNYSNNNNNDGGEGTQPYWEFPPNTFPPNIKFINMTRSWEQCGITTNRHTGRSEHKVCRHIWEKMWRSWIYVSEHHLYDAEWFCKVDYDTFFFPDNLKYYVRDVKGWDPILEHHYFGHVIQHRNRKDRPMVVGASACWSRKTLQGIAQVYRDMPKGSNRGERGKCEDRAHATEEVTTSQCLREHLNIEPEPARDDQLREYITIDQYPLVLSWNRTEQGEWWYWKGKPKDAGQMENTIARRPIGIHKYKKPEEILRLWQEFYGPRGNEALENVGLGRHGEVAKKFVEEVRKAMGIDP